MEVVPKYAHGVKEECVQEGNPDTRIAHAAHASESMLKTSGARTTTKCQNKKTTVGTKVVCEEGAPKDPLERKDLDRWSICRLEFMAKVFDVEDVQESAEEQPSKEGLSQRLQNRMRNSLKKVSPKRIHQKQCMRTCTKACVMMWNQVRRTRQKRVLKVHPHRSEKNAYDENSVVEQQ